MSRSPRDARSTVLVTGAGGQLGRELVARPAGHEVVALGRRDLDVSDPDVVHRVLRQVRPDVVVNAAAWTAVDECERDPARAMAVNGDAAGVLAAAARAVGATLVQVSTDYVFGGTPPPADGTGQRRGWVEDDEPSPVAAYGRSKRAGEVAALEGHDRVHVVRTAWLASAHGGGFVRTMLRLADAGGPVRVVDDQHGSPTFTWDLVDRIWRIVAHGQDTGAFGIWHATNSGACSWFELAAATFDLAGLDVDLGPQSSAALGRPAPRPAWSVLTDTRGEAAGWPPAPHWREGLARLLARLGRI